MGSSANRLRSPGSLTMRSAPCRHCVTQALYRNVKTWQGDQQVCILDVHAQQFVPKVMQPAAGSTPILFGPLGCCTVYQKSHARVEARNGKVLLMHPKTEEAPCCYC